MSKQLYKIYTDGGAVAFHIGEKSGKTLCGKWIKVKGVSKIKSIRDARDTLLMKGCRDCQTEHYKRRDEC